MYIYLCFNFRFTIYDFRLYAQANAKENFRLTIVDFRLKEFNNGSVAG